MARIVNAVDLKSLVDTETGVSDWLLMDQNKINAFADVTEDWQFIHTNPEQAKGTPFGGTIAHGFLILSMLSRMAESTAIAIRGAYMGIKWDPLESTCRHASLSIL